MDIAFYKAWAGGGTTIDKAISIFTLGPYSHCELIFSNGLSFSSSSRDGGVRYKKIKYLPSRWDIIQLGEVKDKQVRTWCDIQLGLKYDYIGVLSHIPSLPFIHSTNRWYCSEICSTVLCKLGMYEGATKISPNALYNELIVSTKE